ncbi:MAG: hypothetical protein QXU32_01205 [Nitrososphaerales archaeon]
MLTRGIIGAIAGGVVVVILFFVMTTTGLLRAPSQGQEFVSMDVVLNLNSVRVVSVDEEKAVIVVAFDAFNPNRNAVVLESIQYSLYADGMKLATSEIGERAEGFITGTGKTFTMYSQFSVTLRDRVEVKKSQFLLPLWEDLKNGSVQWRVSGTSFVTDPVRAGGQELNFDFTA